jgi:hypothetical protein
MMKRLPSKALFLMLALLPSLALAQNCRTEYELIFNLSEPEYGAYNIWDTVYGAQGLQERFVSGLSEGPNSTVVAGERFDKPDGDVKLILSDFDKRGRPSWEQEHTIEGLRSVLKILPADKGYVVFANMQRAKKKAAVWAGFFDAQGQLLSKKLIENSAGDLIAHDVIVTKAGFMLATTLENVADAAPHGVLYSLNSRAATLWERAYMPGLENALLGLTVLEEGDVIATGYIYGEDGRKNGWVVRLDPGGSPVWQRSYPRGRGASLSFARGFLSNFLVLAGDALPGGGKGNPAAWLMLVDATDGDIGWQRYYTGDMSYTARGMIAGKDGIISLLIDGEPLPATDPSADAAAEKEEPGRQDYVRLLTINPRGFLFVSDEFFNAEGSDAWQLVPGPEGSRIIVGATDMVYQDEAQEAKDPLVKKSLDGWVAVAIAAEPYKDPCVQNYSFMP